MRILDIIEESRIALGSSFGRSFLTSLGVMIGIAAIVTMISSISGIQSALISEMGLSKARLVYIMPATKYALTTDLLDELQTDIPEYDAATFQRLDVIRASTSMLSSSVAVYGVEDNYFELEEIRVSEGSIFSNEDNASLEKYALVGPGIKDDYFPDNETVIGEKITLKGVVFTIIGVIKAENSLDQNFSTVFVPEKTASQYLGMHDINYGLAYLSESGDNEIAVDSTFDFLGQYYDLGDARDYFSIMSMETIVSTLELFTTGFGILMAIVASVSLVVGGIGIMNMMLTNVSERLREIGIRLALGAKRSDIAKQFLIESISICLIGGVIGVLLGTLLSFGVSALIQSAISMPITPDLSPELIIGVASVCIIIGVGFGSYPAWKASKLDPIEALKAQ